MKTLYVSDLDGTLLNTQARISPRSLEILNRLAAEGMPFTYATARSLSSASVVTRGLSAGIPVIVYNGAYIMEPATGKILASEGFSPEERAYVRRKLEEHRISPVVYAFVDGEERVSWDMSRVNEGKQRYFDNRKGDRRLRPLDTGDGLYVGETFY